MNLKGKVALVTGGSTGIGEAIARSFVAEGARVCITGRRSDRPVLADEGSTASYDQGGKGSIINIPSLAGLRGGPGTPAYAATKAGLNMLSQQVAVAVDVNGLALFSAMKKP